MNPVVTSAWSRPLESLRGLVLAMWRQGQAIGLFQTAGSLTLLSILAIVPMVAIALTVLTALPMFAVMREALQRFLAANLFLPSFADTAWGYLSDFATKASQLSWFGALVFFATAFTTLMTIDRTLNEIWGARRPRSIGRRITLYWTLLTLGPLFLALSLGVNGVLATSWMAGIPIEALHRFWYRGLSWAIGVVVLALMYYLLPSVVVRWRDALVGAAFVTLVLEGLRHALTTYVTQLPTYTVIYGAFAALPLLLIWLYLAWTTVLVGALLAANLRHWGSGPLVHVRWSPAERFDVATRLLVALTRAWRAPGHDLMSAADLRPITGPDPVRVERLGRVLSEGGYIRRLWRLETAIREPAADRVVWGETWVLARDPGTLTLRALFDTIWEGRLKESRVGDGGRQTWSQAGTTPDPLVVGAPVLDLSLLEIADQSAHEDPQGAPGSGSAPAVIGPGAGPGLGSGPDLAVFEKST